MARSACRPCEQRMQSVRLAASAPHVSSPAATPPGQATVSAVVTLSAAAWILVAVVGSVGRVMPAVVPAPRQSVSAEPTSFPSFNLSRHEPIALVTVATYFALDLPIAFWQRAASGSTIGP